MIIIPHQSHRSARPTTQHDTTVGMLVVAVIMLGIALALFVFGPRSDDPPPLGVGLAVSGLAVIFGLVAFFSWMKEQSDDDRGNNSGKES